jgi:hypothetical protein
MIVTLALGGLSRMIGNAWGAVVEDRKTARVLTMTEK